MLDYSPVCCIICLLCSSLRSYLTIITHEIMSGQFCQSNLLFYYICLNIYKLLYGNINSFHHSIPHSNPYSIPKIRDTLIKMLCCVMSCHVSNHVSIGLAGYKSHVIFWCPKLTFMMLHLNSFVNNTGTVPSNLHAL